MHPPQCFNRIKIIKYKINTQLFSLSSIPIPALHDWNIADKLKTRNINQSINRFPFNTILSHTYFCYNFHEILYVKVYESILFHFKRVQGCLMDNKIFTTDPKHQINSVISLLRHVFSMVFYHIKCTERNYCLRTKRYCVNLMYIFYRH